MTMRGLFLLLFAIPGFLTAQSSGTGEVYAYGGVRDGSHGTAGAGAGVLFAKYGAYFIDIGYTSLGTGAVRDDTPRLRQSRLYDFALLGHVRIPVTRRVEPYGIVGAGVFYNTFQVPAQAPNSPGSWIGRSTTNFAFHTGAGMRYYIHQDWGIRPELKISISGQTYIGFTIGFFYQLPGNF
jgi:hypothetical protein